MSANMKSFSKFVYYDATIKKKIPMTIFTRTEQRSSFQSWLSGFQIKFGPREKLQKKKREENKVQNFKKWSKVAVWLT